MNMFTDNVKARKRGRPPGQTAQGAAARDRLYGTAIRLIAERGYEATTLRDIAQVAGVSVGLLYRYFPSKQAIVIALYDELSAHYERRAAEMPPGSWRERFLFALTASLAVLEPHELALRALTPVLVGDPEEGIFASSTAFSRLRVQRVFEEAVTGAGDAPKAPLGEALGRLLYLVHLAVLALVAARQDPQSASDHGTGDAYAATAALGRAGAAASAGSTICHLGGRPDSRGAVRECGSRVGALMFVLRPPAAGHYVLRRTQNRANETRPTARRLTAERR